MALIRYGNIFDMINAPVDIYVTTNACLTKEGTLVMGKGSALEVARRFPSLPYLFGEHLKFHGKTDTFYGIIPPYKPGYMGRMAVKLDTRFGALQTKIDWRKPTKISLLQKSLQVLDGYAIGREMAEKRPTHCVLPGVGAGKLDLFDAFDLIQNLTTSVTFWFLRP